jgi:hypothetical protein
LRASCNWWRDCTFTCHEFLPTFFRSADGTVKVWELQTMMLKGLFAAHSKNCNCARCPLPCHLLHTVLSFTINACKSVYASAVTTPPPHSSLLVETTALSDCGNEAYLQPRR